MYQNDYSQKAKMLKKIIEDAKMDSIIPEYNIYTNLGPIIMFKKENDELKVNILEILYIEEDFYKTVLKNYPIKKYT